MKRIITFGTYDLLHHGHIRLLERARELGDYLIVGVSTDRLNAEKGKASVFPQDQRLAYIKALSCVDEVFLEDSLELKDHYIKEHQANLLVMGDDWKGKFDWVSCKTHYLSRTKDISSTQIKTQIAEKSEKKILLFGDTYIQKHYDCALSMTNELIAANIIPVFSRNPELPPNLECDGIVYFNLPRHPPPDIYKTKPKILIDHGASHLKWFLASKPRYGFFDRILTAGPDHSRSLAALFNEENGVTAKSRPVGFIKSADILSPPAQKKKDICEKYKLNPKKPLILFAPTWHISANRDMQKAIDELSKIEGVIASLHPETAHLDVSGLTVADNINGMTVELMKHADLVISDTSSTIYEAAALKKPTIQILLKEYSDNSALLYDFPHTAGTAELFCGGLCVRPEDISDAIEQCLGRKKQYKSMLAASHERILRGTYIDTQCHDRIIAELKNIENIPNRLGESKSPAQHNLAHADNLFFVRQHIIAQAGGTYDKLHNTYAKEAVQAAYKATTLVELNFVKSKDGIIAAKADTESFYGLSAPFGTITTTQFLSQKFQNKLTPVDLDNALDICLKPRRALVCSIPATGDEYIDIAKTIINKSRERNFLNRLVIKSYCEEDFIALKKLGSVRIILDTQKFFSKEPVGDKAFNFVKTCQNIDNDKILSLCIPYGNKRFKRANIDNLNFARFHGFWKRIFITNAPIKEYERILRRNLGLFADSLDSHFEFKDAPSRFNWRHYLFLNFELLDMGVDTQISAMLHYLKHGQTEKRLTAYNIPEGFSHRRYLDKNPDLIKAGISEKDSAKAHWTRYGCKEDRNYE